MSVKEEHAFVLTIIFSKADFGANKEGRCCSAVKYGVPEQKNLSPSFLHNF
jgi:hypothetical protein